MNWVAMLSTELECFLQRWNSFHKVGMLSTELEYLCAELECYELGWNAFYSVGLLSTGLECFLE
jgi:hypothetical protein